MAVILDPITGITFNDLTIQSSAAPPVVRQTVLSGPVDTNGLAAFGGSTGSATVTATATLKASAASGGDLNYTGSIVNPSWTGLSTNGTMYVYLDITVGGVVTAVSTALQPIYQWGGTPSIVNGQHTFNIQEMKMYTGNGTTAPQVFRVFVGEVTVAGGVVSAITWYALMARSARYFASPVASTNYYITHNIGVQPAFINVRAGFIEAAGGNYWESPPNGYTSGADSAVAWGGLAVAYSSRNSTFVQTATSMAVYGPVPLTFANCSFLVVRHQRAW
jgi:hypothetical protein